MNFAVPQKGARRRPGGRAGAKPLPPTDAARERSVLSQKNLPDFLFSPFLREKNGDDPTLSKPARFWRIVAVLLRLPLFVFKGLPFWPPLRGGFAL